MMIKKVRVISIVILLIVSIFIGVFEATIQDGIKDDFVSIKQSLAKGSGTINDPYLIYDVHDLQNMSEDLSAHYVLANDIDASETEGWNDGAGFEPIGTVNHTFSGNFNGYNYTIYGLHIYRPDTNSVGLFGYIGSTGSATDVVLHNSNISGRGNTGLLAGVIANGGRVSHISANGTVNGLFSNIGGLVGNGDGIIEDSHVDVEVRGNGSVGGIGGNWGGIIYNSHAVGMVEGYMFIGGAVGHFEGTTINVTTNCNVDGHTYIGGLVGINEYGIIENSSSISNVSGDISVGGLVGYNGLNGRLLNASFTGSVTGKEGVGGLVGHDAEGRIGIVSNSHYNINETSINNGRHITIGGLFTKQFNDWVSNDLVLDIRDYNETLVPNEDHYEISSIQSLKDLLGFSGMPEYKFRLTADIDLSIAEGLYIPYLAGVFDGDNHTISNLYLHMPFAYNIGLFGYIRRNAVIKNIFVVDANVEGNQSVGGLAGFNDAGTIFNSHVTGTVTGYKYIGGLLGNNYYIGDGVSNSSAIGVTNGCLAVGGLIGINFLGASLLNSYAKSNVTGVRDVGGIVGINTHSRVSNSYSIGNVNGDGAIGGLLGSHSGLVENSYAESNVSGDVTVGGLVGHLEGHVINSYSNGHVSGDRNVGGIGGVVIGQGKIDHSYSTSNVIGNRMVGGLVGANYGMISNSYFRGNIFGEHLVGGLIGIGPWVSNSHYNIDDVLINGGHYITIGGLFDIQFKEWKENNLTLNIEYYQETLVPSEDYYEISSIQGIRDVLGFAVNSEYKFRLAEDIDFSSDLGLYIPSLYSKFDGNGFSIYNLHIDQSFSSYTGFFGFNSHLGVISNLSIIDMDVSSYKDVGGLVGLNKGKVFDSYTSGSVDGVNNNIGGLVGYNGGMVYNSYANGTITGNCNIGGLVGLNWGPVENSYAVGDVNGKERVGGLVGQNFHGPVENSYATGTVTRKSGSTDTDFGGFVGHNYQGKIINCYSTSSVHYEDEDDPTDKGFAGSVDTGGNYEMIGNFWDVDTSGQTSTAGNATGKTTEEMMDISTFIDAGWDITTVDSKDKRDTDYIWNIVNHESYPFFSRVFFTLEVHISGNGTVDSHPWSYTYVYGTQVDVTAVPDEGWYFSHWSGDVPEGQEQDKEITIVMDSDKELTAHFDQIYYNLTIAVEGNGTTNPPVGNHTYNYGQEVVVEAIPAEGWYFSHWTGDVPEGEETDENITVIMDDNKTLTAHFQQIYYNLSIAVEGEGTTEPGEGNYTYAYGTEVDITTIPDEGWYFSHWSGDVPEGEEHNETITIFMDDNRSLTAHFGEIILPTVEIISPDDGKIIDEDTVTVEWGCEEGTYPISHYEIRLNEGDWIDVGMDTQYTFEGLDEGEYTVTVRAVDDLGNYSMESIHFTVDTGWGQLWILPVIGIVIVLLAMIISTMKNRKQQDKFSEKESEIEGDDEEFTEERLDEV